MPSLHPLLKKSYWVLAGLGGIWATFMILLTNPWFQRHALYMHKINSGYWNNVSNPESFGFAKGQVTPFNLSTSDGETLFCWHVLPLDVYLNHESEIVQKVTGMVDDLTTTVGYKLMKKDHKSRVVVNFHGNAGHLAEGFRPNTYRSLSGIPHTHVLTCDYRGFGRSSVNNAPHLPTEPGLITDGISLIHYLLTTLQHPASRTVLLGQSLGTAITAASALYFTNPTNSLLPSSIVGPTPELDPQSFAGIVLVSSFPSLHTLLNSYKIRGLIPVLSPLRPYPRLSKLLSNRILDHWPTQERLEALLTTSQASKTAAKITLLHARNDQDIDFKLSETVFQGCEAVLRGDEGAISFEERRSIHGHERVKRGAFAYRKVEDGEAAAGRGEGRTVELEVVRYGGHNEVVGFAQVSLAVRRAFAGNKSFKPGLDTE
ncbi:Alpha/Beta hydrolase protein [Clohesyomyces aquaticus]|uniref:Alpha/Beta hydrolase protein n=1 Tax=Clohesyomyces aquaticus TaxID=1231657 RepID=A0A1Y2AC43_9PLEO|nr:Alpha/Beta hydrolase protein [Clohesyomyces aquaticus]